MYWAKNMRRKIIQGLLNTEMLWIFLFVCCIQMNARKKKGLKINRNLWITNKKQLKFDIGRVSDAANPNKIDSNRVFFTIIVGIG